MTQKTPDLSVVAVSRNDNHGESLIYRMKHFVHGFITQCNRHQLHAELILVEWNPLKGELSLQDVLDIPKETGCGSIRIITVPASIHATLKNSDKIPLFQMIGKNVGIRRAKGRFILSTNIDIIFSDPLFKFLKQGLKEGFSYRVDRVDIPGTLPFMESYPELLSFCAKNVLRMNTKNGTIFPKKTSFSALIPRLKNIKRLTRRVLQILWHASPAKGHSFFMKMGRRYLKSLYLLLFPNSSLFLHTNACGDFTLLSKSDWDQLKGYPEWPIHSWHLDSVLLYQAKQHGIQEKVLSRSQVVYHIEHSLGSGYCPENENAHFHRLERLQVPYLSNKDFFKIRSDISQNPEKIVFNDEDWGLAKHELQETSH